MLNQIQKKQQTSRRKFLKTAGKGGVAVAAFGGLLTSAPSLVTAKSKSYALATPFKLPQDPLFTSA
jgi:anaerobic selenocysteine-containing dehydrogenase